MGKLARGITTAKNTWGEPTLSEDGWLRTHASLVIRKAPEMTRQVRSGVARWLREQADFVETRAHEMDDVYSPRFMHGDEIPFSERDGHLRAARDHENAQRRSRKRARRATRRIKFDEPEPGP